ncbi:Uncharacterised protein [Lysinibacillus sphaericus]|uniref:Uncharacterized protein n=1 Tax=Lysinibacillus sphaericus TaxID=1421 RepID=A0AAJ4ZY24_LYSSH|nr:Uncharacterised protein [Lysinibacillus sphaericus]
MKSFYTFSTHFLHKKVLLSRFVIVIALSRKNVKFYYSHTISRANFKTTDIPLIFINQSILF